MKLEKDQKERLYIVSSQNQAITKISPHLFHISASEMKDGWIARFRHNRLNLPIETIISDPEGNIYYFYLESLMHVGIPSNDNILLLLL